MVGELVLFGGSGEPERALTGTKQQYPAPPGGYNGTVVRPYDPRGPGYRLSAVFLPSTSSQGLSAPPECKTGNYKKRLVLRAKGFLEHDTSAPEYRMGAFVSRRERVVVIINIFLQRR